MQEVKKGIRNICRKVGEKNVRHACPGFFYNVPVPKELHKIKKN